MILKRNASLVIDWRGIDNVSLRYKRRVYLEEAGGGQGDGGWNSSSDCLAGVRALCTLSAAYDSKSITKFRSTMALGLSFLLSGRHGFVVTSIFI